MTLWHYFAALFLATALLNPAVAQQAVVQQAVVQQAVVQQAVVQQAVVPPSSYVLGPGDQVTLKVLEAEEVPDKPFRIDEKGSIDVPMVGAVQAAGLTVHQLQELLVRRFTLFIRKPQITVFVLELRSQPVSVLGAVHNSGTYQLQGHKTLVEMLALAGGLRPDSGYRVRITRRAEWGAIPLASATTEGDSFVGEVALKGLIDARNPSENIAIMPNDVLTVPVAELIYVIGDVKKSGGFVMGERRSVSVLQALAMAEGTTNLAKPTDARILRTAAGSDTRSEIPVDLKKILSGRATDVPMQSNDILFVPTNGAKRLRDRALEAAFSIGSGVAIYRP